MTAADLLTDLARRGIRLEAHGGRLRYSPRSAVTPELMEGMRNHKPELLTLVAYDRWQLYESSAWDDLPEPLEPHGECSGLNCWWDATGQQHCADCDPPTASRRWLREREKLLAKLAPRRRQTC